MATALHAHRIPKSILKRPDSPKKRGNVNFSAVVIVIGQAYTEALVQGNDDDLKLDVSPTKNAVVTPTNAPIIPQPAPKAEPVRVEPTRAEPVRTESRGTMRIKGMSVQNMIGQYADPTPAPTPTLIPSVSSTTPAVDRKPAIKEGFLKLLKESGMKSSWMKRYIVLERSTIAYYRANDAPKALKSFDLHGDCFVRELKEKMGVAECKNVLEVFIDKKNAMILQATSQRELTEWITAICGVIDTFNANALGDDDYEFYDEEEEGDKFDVPITNTRGKAPSLPSAPVMPFSLSTSVTTSEGLEDEDDYEWIDEDEIKPAKETPFPANSSIPAKLPTESKQKEQELAKQKELELAKKKEQELAKQKEAELAKKKEQELAKQKEAELAKQKEAELAKQKEAELVKQRELAKQKELELVKKKEQEFAKQKEAELAKQKEAELAKKKEAELAKKKEQDLARQREEEKEREREALRQKEIELNKQIELAREREQEIINKHKEDQMKPTAVANVPSTNQQKLLPTVKKVPAPVGRKPRTGTLPPTLSRPATAGGNRPAVNAPAPAIVAAPTPTPQPAAPVVTLKPVGQRAQTNPVKPINQNGAPAVALSNSNPVAPAAEVGVDQSRANKVSNLLKMFENR